MIAITVSYTYRAYTCIFGLMETWFDAKFIMEPIHGKTGDDISLANSALSIRVASSHATRKNPHDSLNFYY